MLARCLLHSLDSSCCRAALVPLSTQRLERERFYSGQECPDPLDGADASWQQPSRSAACLKVLEVWTVEVFGTQPAWCGEVCGVSTPIFLTQFVSQQGSYSCTRVRRLSPQCRVPCVPDCCARHIRKQGWWGHQSYGPKRDAGLGKGQGCVELTWAVVLERPAGVAGLFSWIHAGGCSSLLKRRLVLLTCVNLFICRARLNAHGYTHHQLVDEPIGMPVHHCVDCWARGCACRLVC